MSHPGDYLTKRMGRGRQCWKHCDKTPCGCPKSYARIVRKRERLRAKREILEVRE